MRGERTDRLDEQIRRMRSQLASLEVRFLVGKPLANFVASDDRADLRALINAFASAGSVEEWSVRLVPRDGTPISVSIAAAAARDMRNELVGIRWMVRDVTMRVHNERAILALADQRQAILDAAPEGICRLDPDGNVDYANPAAARMLGYAEADLSGRALIDVLLEGK